MNRSISSSNILVDSFGSIKKDRTEFIVRSFNKLNAVKLNEKWVDKLKNLFKTNSQIDRCKLSSESEKYRLDPITDQLGSLTFLDYFETGGDQKENNLIRDDSSSENEDLNEDDNLSEDDLRLKNITKTLNKLNEYNKINLDSNLLSTKQTLNQSLIKEFEFEKIDDQPKECFYCKFDNEKFLVKCNDCSLYFCNQKGQLKESHIFHHLIRAKHNDVDFDLKRVSGNSKACNLCECRNIFNLGFLISNKNKRYLLCRAPCKCIEEIKHNGKLVAVQRPFFENYDQYFQTLRIKLPHLFINGEATLRDSADGICYNFKRNSKHELVDLTEWRPLVLADKVLNNFIFDRTNQIDFVKCKKVNSEQVEKIEKELDQFRKVQDIGKFGFNLNDLINEEDLTQFIDKPVLLVYENGTEYYDVFHRLVKIQNSENDLTDEENIGQEIILERTTKALKRFKSNKMKMNDEIYEIILGHNKIKSPVSDEQLNPTDYQAPNLPELNQSQALAIKHALENPFTLIQGPPGTGKTHTSASIVYNLSKKQSIKKEQILVCAPSNIACDHLAAKIKQTKLDVVRLLSKTKEQDETYYSPLSIRNHPKYLDPNSEHANLKEILESRQKNGVPVSESDARKLENLENVLLNTILREADVIVVTCVTCGSNRLRGKFKYLLIDEVAQSTEPEVLIPLNNRIEKLILIGDIQQLSPVIKNRALIEVGFDQSMMQRLTALGNATFMLDTQYRMHPMISKFSSENFYNGNLKDGVTEKDRILTKSTFKWPTNKPTFFISCKEEEQISATGHSYLNAKEGCVIGRLIFKLINNGIKPNQIGIITPYEGQRSYLRTNLKFFSKNVNYDKIEIASINSYQGKEKDIIILSTVRSNPFKGKRSIGFLSDSRRLNVALTRAKYGLIIVGDESTLCNEKIWYRLLKFYQDNNLIFTGPVNDLVRLDCNLRRPNIFDMKCFKLKNNYHIKRVDPDKNIVEYDKI